MAKRKVDLTDFFSPGRAPVPTLDGPKSLFASNAERRQKVTVMRSMNGGKSHKSVSIYVFNCCRDGTITGGCHHVCHRQYVDFLHFAPEDPGAHTKFVTAYDAFQAAHREGDRAECLEQLEILIKLRINECAKCRDKKLSPAEQACKDCYDGLRKAAAMQNDGCAHADCPVRGPDVWQVLTADHGTKPKATHEVKNKKTGVVTIKPLCLSTYTTWPKVGGVPAMEAEAAQIEKWICHCCHNLEPTSNSGRRCGDPATMPKGKARSGTPLETQQYKARHKAKIVYPKQQHVDARKRAIGACATCARAIVSGTEPAFEFNHLDEATKCKGGIFRSVGGVAGLVGNCAKAAALDQVQAKLDAEMAKCELLCSNCHHRHTHKYGADGEEEEE